MRKTPAVIRRLLGRVLDNCSQTRNAPARNAPSCTTVRYRLATLARRTEVWIFSGSPVRLRTLVKLKDWPERGRLMRIERTPAAVGGAPAKVGAWGDASTPAGPPPTPAAASCPW